MYVLSDNKGFYQSNMAGRYVTESDFRNVILGILWFSVIGLKVLQLSCWMLRNHIETENLSFY